MKLAPALAFAGMSLFASFSNAAAAPLRPPLPEINSCLPVTSMETILKSNAYHAVYSFQHPSPPQETDLITFLYAQKNTGNWMKVDVKDNSNLCISMTGTDLQYVSVQAMEVQFKEPEKETSFDPCIGAMMMMAQSAVLNGTAPIFEGRADNGASFYIYEDVRDQATSMIYQLYGAGPMMCVESQSTALISHPIKAGLLEVYGYFNNEVKPKFQGPSLLTPYFWNDNETRYGLLPSPI